MGARAFCRRTVILAVQTLAVTGLRIYANGETSPDFVYEQNPAGFSKEAFTRIFSVNWVYCLYIVDVLYPKNLAPDWSGYGIDLIESIGDPRAYIVIILWAFLLGCLASLVSGYLLSPGDEQQQQQLSFRRIALTAIFGFVVTPFLLSSNLLITTGLMKADRVIYLPSLGICMLQALVLQTLCFNGTTLAKNIAALNNNQGDGASDDEDEGNNQNDENGDNTNEIKRVSALYWLGYTLVMVQLFLFSAKLHERNYAWSDIHYLWTHAYEINNKSWHTVYNAGHEWNKLLRYEECEQVLRPIADARTYDGLATFLYSLALKNLGRCAEVPEMIQIALDDVARRREEGGLRNENRMLDREESSLLAALGFCIEDNKEAYKLMFRASEIDPSNGFATQQIAPLMNQFSQMNQQRISQGQQPMPLPDFLKAIGLF